MRLNRRSFLSISDENELDEKLKHSNRIPLHEEIKKNKRKANAEKNERFTKKFISI